MSPVIAGNGLRLVAGALMLSFAAGCGATASSNDAAAQPVATASEAAPSPAASASASTALAAVPTAASPASCPARWSSADALPASARLLGTAGASPLALSSATVTADAPAAIASDTGGMAEVEPDERPETGGAVVQSYDADPSTAQPYTLVCRYGAVKPGLMAEAVLLLPIAPGAHYRCTTVLPQGTSRRPVKASCTRTGK